MPSLKEMTTGMLEAVRKASTITPSTSTSTESDESKAKLLGTGTANRTANVIMKRKKQLDEIM